MIEYFIGGAAAYVSYQFARRVVYPALRPKIKGYLGERKTIKILNKLPPDDYVVLNDLLLPTGRDTTQVDHVVVSKYGIFYVESKNFSGMVSGKEWDKEWLQMTGRTALPIPNPIRQNYKHRKALEHVLSGFSHVPVIPVVAIANSCKLDVESNKTLVVNHKHLLDGIKSFSVEPVISKDQMTRIVRTLEKANILDRGQRRRHKALIKANRALPMDDEISKVIEEGKNSPIISFSPQPTAEERNLQKKINAFHEQGPILTIKGRTDTIDGFLENARRNADNTVADAGKPFDHIVCPYTGAQFPASECANLERGLWLTYLNKHPELAQLTSTKDGLEELFPEPCSGSAIVRAYHKGPAVFISKAKETAWYKNLQESFRSHSVDHHIHQAEQQKEDTYSTAEYAAALARSKKILQQQGR